MHSKALDLVVVVVYTIFNTPYVTPLHEPTFMEPASNQFTCKK